MKKITTVDTHGSFFVPPADGNIKAVFYELERTLTPDVKVDLPATQYNRATLNVKNKSTGKITKIKVNLAKK